jgi:hypothetical protein
MPKIRAGVSIVMLFHLAALGAPILCASAGHYALESAFTLCCDEGSGSERAQSAFIHLVSSQNSDCSDCTDVPLMASAAGSNSSRVAMCLPGIHVPGRGSPAGASYAVRQPAAAHVPTPVESSPSQLRC